MGILSGGGSLEAACPLAITLDGAPPNARTIAEE
jgi:hypothetical protein